MRKLDIKDITKKILHLHKTIECGVHSGFPMCCIQFYVTKKLWMTDRQNRIYLKKIRDKEIETGFPIRYIPCPDCLKENNFVMTEECPNHIHCNHIDECSGYR